MSFDKHYPNRKDWRKPYRGAKQCDRSCKNHGSCPRCRSGRKKWKKLAAIEEKELMDESFESDE